jgi:hypothetical protein
MKWENFGAFLSRLLRWEIFLSGFLLSEFHCSSDKNNKSAVQYLSSYSETSESPLLWKFVVDEKLSL